MSRASALFTLTVFFVWILPLGVFIKPWQEKAACGGQRAICLCSNLINKSEGKAAPVNTLRAVPPTQQKESGAGASSEFLPDRFSYALSASVFRLLMNDAFLYAFRFSALIEHVPRA